MPEDPAPALASLDHEELVVRRGRRTGVYTIVAVHSTARGPSLGGCRMWRYADSAAGAARDALRLSRAMTFKSAAAGLPLGGGKGVICAEPGPPPTGRQRRDMLLDFADTVDMLDGRYVTAEDVGTSADDMTSMREATTHVDRPRPREGRLAATRARSPRMGVEAAIRACLARRFGTTATCAGRTVAIVGAGHVGGALARRLANAGANLTLADIDEGRRDARPGARRALGEPERRRCAPRSTCWRRARSAGRSTHRDPAPERPDRLRRGQQPARPRRRSPTTWPRTASLYAPDFVVNAGGIINIAVELEPTATTPTRRDRPGRRRSTTTMTELLDSADAQRH